MNTIKPITWLISNKHIVYLSMYSTNSSLIVGIANTVELYCISIRVFEYLHIESKCSFSGEWSFNSSTI